jgi:cell division protein FtsQ
MDRQPALALARPRVAPSLKAVRRRAVLVVASGIAALGLLYLGARETPVFAMRTVEVQGASGSVRAAVLQEVDGVRGESLVALDGGALVRRLEALPSVEAVAYDRAFPHTLRLVVQPERPAAVVKQGTSLWVVSVRGRVISRALPGVTPALPRIRYPDAGALVPGEFVADEVTKTVLAALALAPKRMLLPIHSGRLEDGQLTFELSGEGGTAPLLLLGDPEDVGIKLKVAALVLRKLSPEELSSLAYLDVSLPDRPVASANPQVSG